MARDIEQLAHVEKIVSIEPIVGADQIELATVLGWQVVVRKDENYKPGDLCIYIEIDSILPLIGTYKDTFDFFTSKGHTRLRTAKMRGALSQGLIMPLSILPRGEWKEGDDVGEILNLAKYEPSVPNAQLKMKGWHKTFPSHLVSKTDEERIQNCPALCKEGSDIWGKPYYITVKCDGTSFTALYLPQGDFGVCSRNNMSIKSKRKKFVRWLANKKILIANFLLRKCKCRWIKYRNPMYVYDQGNIYVQAAEKYGLDKLLKEYPNLAIQAELCGPGIQKNRLGLEEPTLFVFDIYDMSTHTYYTYHQIEGLCKKWGISQVPLLEEGAAFSYTQEQLLYKADGKYEGTKNLREGIVVRLDHPTKRVSFKVISNKYLLGDPDA